MEGTLTMAERLAALDAAQGALEGLDSRLWELGTDQLGPLVERLDGLGLLAQAGQVATVAEAVERGETGSRESWVAGWALKHAPSLRAGGARALASVAASFAKPANVPVREAVLAGTLPVRSAASVLAEADRLRPRLAEGAEPHVLEGLVDVAVSHGPSGPRGLRALMLAKHGLDGELQGEQDHAKALVALSQPHATDLGTFEYRLTLDAEGHTVLEAALGPLAAPRPAQGCSDTRSGDQRRGDALVEVVRRGVAAADGIPTAAKASVFVTVDHATLTGQAGPGQTRAGTVCGGTATGTLLAPETLRRMACDADLIPVVLGTRGEVLDLGRRKRLFTSAQTRALWVRDGGCTYPGCSIPAQWADAHHLWHWADGGPTDLAWAALLCGRHHTVVHRRRLHGRVTDHEVEWDLTPGSYDTFLAEQIRHDAGRSPGPPAPPSSQPRSPAIRSLAPTGTGGAFVMGPPPDWR